MPYRDLREFVAFLEAQGDLRRISAPVSTQLEMTEIAYRSLRADGPAILFENVVGHDMPVAINLFCSERRMNWALGVEDAGILADRLEGMIEMVQGGPPQGVLNKLRTLGRLVHVGAYQPRTISNAPCQQVVLSGEDVDLYSLPIIKCWPMDAGPYITLPLVITRDPETGTQNYGIYRMQVFDRSTTGMHWQTHKVGARHYRASSEKLEVAVALGGDPASIWTGSAPLPPDIDEMVLAGFIRDEGVELAQAVSVDLRVPAHAEIVLEGYVIPGEERTEGPFGDHTGYYSLAEPYPVFHVTTITRRHNPIYPTTFVGRPPTEDYWMGKVTERVFLPLIRLILPEVVDINMPAEGIFHNLVLVSMKKEYPGHARKVMYGLWGLGLLSLTKVIVVVDDFVDVQNPSEVAWRVANNINPATDLVLVDGPIDDLDVASPTPRFGSKVGIDATRKGPQEGYHREWPPDIEMSPEIRERVSARWAELGMDDIIPSVHPGN
jgi:4-hydroxy-3-polyprenylbenzoate decarboxylase